MSTFGIQLSKEMATSVLKAKVASAELKLLCLFAMTVLPERRHDS